jgi:flavin-dependent dehydrogenase
MLETKFDVIITGGGLAGLSLARQLKLNDESLNVLVLEKQKGPLPSATHKIGESSIEVGAYYYGQVLGLEDYIEESHYEKLGLRYYFKNDSEKFEDRLEYGVDDFLPRKSYQFNRGTFENHLRETIVGQGVTLLENASCLDISITEDNEENTIVFEQDGTTYEKNAKWIVDATGRNRILQNKLGFKKEVKKTHSSIWFRVKSTCDIAQLVPKENVEWHERIKQPRWLSTNHIMGEGYWMWIIPLTGDYTSFGIVASEEFHPYKTFNTRNKAKNWIEENEPEIARLIDGLEWLDFKGIRNYSHSSTKVISENGWACVGEAGVFADPFYSVGSNLIAYANSMVTNLICNVEDSEKEEHARHYNSYLISHCESLTHIIQAHMPYMGNGYIAALKIIWDTFIGWGISDPIFYNDVYLCPKKSKMIYGTLLKLSLAQLRIVEFFDEWSKKSNTKVDYQFLDCLKDLPTLCDVYTRNLPSGEKSFEEVYEDIQYSFEKLEEFGNIVFQLAVQELYPEEADAVSNRWIDITEITLDKDDWELGLFDDSEKRDIEYLKNEVYNAFNMNAALVS